MNLRIDPECISGSLVSGLKIKYQVNPCIFSANYNLIELILIQIN